MIHKETVQKIISWIRTQLRKLINKWLPVLIVTFGLILLANLLFTIFVSAYAESIYFKGYPTNGAFQLFDPLRRIADHQTPGVDFQFFHGLGVVYLHYPIFLLLGQNLFASEMSRWIVSPLVSILVGVIFIYSLTRRWSLSLLAGAVITYIGSALYPELFWPANSLLGLRSAYPVVFASILILFLESWKKKVEHSKQFNRWPILEYLCSAFLVFSFFFGSEHGLASFVAFTATFFFFFPYHTSFKQRFVRTVYFVGFYILNLCLLYFLISGIHFLEPLKYALVDVPNDQFWFFGVPPNPYLETIKNFFVSSYIYNAFVLAIILLIPAILISIRKKTTASFIVIFLLLYGLLANVSLFGYYFKTYTQPLVRIEILVVVWYMLLLVPKIFSVFQKNRFFSLLTLKEFHFYSFSIFMLSAFVFMNFYYPRPLARLEQLLQDVNITGVSHQGVYLDDFWKNAEAITFETMNSDVFLLDPVTDVRWTNGINNTSPGFAIRYTQTLADKLTPDTKLLFAGSGVRTIKSVYISSDLQWIEVSVDQSLRPDLDGYPHPVYFGEKKPDVLLWSVYAGVLDAELGEFNPSFDYIIHALGPKKRQEYVDKFRTTKPKYVISMKREFFVYEDWLRNEDWPFYRELLENYEATSRTNYSIIWKYTGADTESVEQDGDEKFSGQMNVDGSTIIIDIPDDRTSFDIVEVTLHYSIQNPWKFIPYFGKLPRFLITPLNTLANTAVSLVPYQDTMQFPILVAPENKDIQLNINTVSVLPGVSIQVDSAEWNSLNNISDQTKRHFIGLP